MGEIGSGNGSSYPGTLDTDTTLETTSTSAREDVPNDLAADIIAIETELGTDPAGTKTDVKTYLQIEHATDGTHSDITADSLTVYGEKKWAVGGDIASATTLTIDTDGDYFDITGTTTITSFSSVGIGTVIKLHFDGALTLTHHSTNLVLPLGQNIITYNGLELTFVEYASTDWRLIGGINASAKPSFSVHRNGVNQTSITGIDKIEWTTEEFDTNSDFDNSTNYRFTPTIAGKYFLSSYLIFQSAIDGDGITMFLYKNGSAYKEVVHVTAGVSDGININAVVDANGSTDYFEIFALNSARDTSQVAGDSDESFFTGCKID